MRTRFFGILLFVEHASRFDPDTSVPVKIKLPNRSTSSCFVKEPSRKLVTVNLRPSCSCPSELLRSPFDGSIISGYLLKRLLHRISSMHKSSAGRACSRHCKRAHQQSRDIRAPSHHLTGNATATFAQPIINYSLFGLLVVKAAVGAKRCRDHSRLQSRSVSEFQRPASSLPI